MMRVFASDRLEELVSAFAEVVEVPLASPMRAEQVVVPAGGMARWLTQALALRFGVCANVELRSPMRFVRWAVSGFAGEAGEAGRSLFDSREELEARVAALLPTLLEEPEFAAVRHYLGSDEDTLRLQLASHVAGAFQAVVAHRPVWARAWDRDEAVVCDSAAAHEPWQRRLWQRVEPGPPKHAAALALAHAERCERACSEAATPAHWPQRVLVFAPALSALEQDVLRATARALPVHVFTLAAPEAASTHPLVTSLLPAAQARHARLSSHASVVSPNASESADEPASLLGTLQRDIRHGAPAAGALSSAADAATLLADGSLQVHVCHTPLREVEVLHDRLLDAFDRDRTLHPEQVLVRVRDIDLYAPFVESVFGHRAVGEAHIPFSIAGARPHLGDGPAAALLAALALLRGRFEGPEVMDLLSLSPVRERLDLSDADLVRVQAWLADAGACWGVDGADRARFGSADTAQNTFRFALDRMLLGVAMDAQSGRTFAGVLPLDDVEGQMTEVLGRVADWLDGLATLRAEASCARSASAWRVFVESTLAHVARASRAQRGAIQRKLAAWVQAWEQAERDIDQAPSLSFDSVERQLRRRLAPSAGLRGAFGGGVCFLPMGAAVGAPARVLALLGMDDSYPRRGGAPTFDLVAQHPATSDPSPRGDDRERFLWALLSAQQRLLISYVGRDARTNELLPPSVVLAELLDALDARFPAAQGQPAARERVTCAHPFPPFSPRYFHRSTPDATTPATEGRADEASSGPALFSYAHRYLPAARALAQASGEPRPFFEHCPAPEPSHEREVVDLADLIRTLQRPTASYLRRTLELVAPREAQRLEAREAMSLDNLERWKQRDHMLRARLRGRDDASIGAELMASGALPTGTLGELWFSGHRREVADILHWARARGGEPLPPRPVRVELADATLVGELATLSRGADGQLRHGEATVSVLQGRRLLAAWIRHLVYCASYDPGPSWLVSAEQGGARVERFEPVDDAIERLEGLLRIYRFACRACLPVFEHTSYWWARLLLTPAVPEPSDEEYLLAAEREFTAARRQRASEADEWENVTVWQHDNPFRLDFQAIEGEPGTTFLALAKDLYLPPLRQLERETTLEVE